MVNLSTSQVETIVLEALQSGATAMAEHLDIENVSKTVNTLVADEGEAIIQAVTQSSLSRYNGDNQPLNVSDSNPAFKIQDDQRQALREAFYSIPKNVADMRDMFIGFINDDLASLQKKAGADLMESMTHKAKSRDVLAMVHSATCYWTPENYAEASEEAILTEMLRVVNDAALRGAYTQGLLPYVNKLIEYVGDALNECGFPSLNPLYESDD